MADSLADSLRPFTERVSSTPVWFPTTTTTTIIQIHACVRDVIRTNSPTFRCCSPVAACAPHRSPEWREGGIVRFMVCGVGEWRTGQRQRVDVHMWIEGGTRGRAPLECVSDVCASLSISHPTTDPCTTHDPTTHAPRWPPPWSSCPCLASPSPGCWAAAAPPVPPGSPWALM